MSRYELPTTEGLEVVVGWDPPLRTYFAQAWDRRLEEDDPAAELCWIGCSLGEITDPRQATAAVSRWAEIPPDLIDKLTADAN